MGDITREKLNEFRANHRQGRRFTALFLAASLMVSAAVGYGLRQTGVSATADYFCGQEEHTHSEACYTEEYICGLEAGETEPTEPFHTHVQDCYEEQTVQVCGLREHAHGEGCYTLRQGSLICETPEHTHGEDCFDEEGNQVCELEEHTHGESCYAPGELELTCQEPEHTHEESCFETQTVLACELPTEPQEPVIHEHSENCLEKVLTCGQEEHTHTERCLSDETADVEGPEEWGHNAGSPNSGFWAEDLLAVARAQLGYSESQRNFTQAEDGTHHGYTRYGAWYGDPYGSWNGMFLAYCLHYAGVPASVVPQRAGVSALLAETDPKWLRDSSYAPQCGDIAIYDGSVGIVSQVNGGVTAIAGDVGGTVAGVTVSGEAQYIAVAEAFSATAIAVLPNPDQMDVDGGFDDVAMYAAYKTVNLEDHVDYVTIRYGNSQITLKKGDTVPTLEIKDGDTVQVEIHYRFDDVTLRTEEGTYQLPEGLNPSASSGYITDNEGKLAGSFEIDDDGLITVKYNDNIWDDNSSQSGNIYFTGTATATGDETKDTWNFPGIGEVKITKKEDDTKTDSYIQKNTVDQTFTDCGNGYVKITYQVELGTQNGTGNDLLTITDKLNNLLYGNDKSNLIKGKYDETSFKVVKQGSGENLIGTGGVTLTVSDNDTESPTAEVSGLPPLAAGEKYILTYDVLIPKADFVGNELRYVRNTVEDSRDDKTQKDVKVDQKLQKTSSFDKKTGRITWTITVNNPIGSVDGYTVWDQLPAGLTKDDICGNITIWDKNNRQTTLEKDSDAFNKFFGTGYTFPEGSDAPPYRFVFETEVPDFGDEDQISVKNTAKLTPEEETTVEVEREQTVSRDQWSLGKSRVDVQEDRVYWELDASNVLGSKKFTVTDTIQNAVKKGDYSETQISNTHYGIEAEIEAALRDVDTGLYVTLEDGTKVTYADILSGTVTDVTFTITYHTEPETGHVRSFDITVESAGQAVTAIHADSYPTHINISAMPDAETWIFINRVNIDRIQAQAEYEYTKAVDFTKVVSVDNGVNWGTDQDVSYAQAVSQKLKYRIQLTFDGNRTEDFVIKDKLPEGGTLVNSGYWIYIDRTDNAIHNIPFAVDEDNVLTLTIPYEYYKWNVSGEGTHTLVITYVVSIEDDPAWDDLLTGSVNYRNTASWDGKWAETDTLVKRYQSDLVKEGQQIFATDANGDDTIPTNKILYTIVINPNGEMLGNGEETLTVEDTLSLPSGLSGTLDYSSLALYHFQEVGGKLDLTSRATPIKTEYDTTKPNWFRMTIPNGTPLVLQYVYEVDMSKVNPGSFSVDNTAKIGNQTVSSKSMKVVKQEAGGSISGSKIRLVKRDKDSGELVQGAAFRIDRYVSSTGSWENVWQGKIETGQLELPISVSDADNDALHTDTLYRIVEEQAPEHYLLDSTPKYVIFYNENDGASGAFQRATGSSDTVTVEGTEIRKSDVLYDTVSGVTVVAFDNQYNRLDVKKIWVDATGTEIPAPVDEITVILKRYTDSIENAVDFETVTLKKSEGWAHSWDNLEKTDANGQTWRYTITEVLPSENWKLWTVSYANNGGIQTGLIQIKNTVSGNYTYELPKTGGSGINDYVLLGLLAMALAMGGLIVNRKKFTGANET